MFLIRDLRSISDINRKELNGISKMNRIFYLQRMTVKSRIDQLLVARGFCASREKAQRAIMAGRVIVGGQKAEKPGLQVPEDAIIELRAGDRYVGRGGLKLEAALDRFALSVEGKISLIVGRPPAGSRTACFSVAPRGFMPLMWAMGSSTGSSGKMRET